MGWVGVSGESEFVGGLRAGGLGATWPLARLGVGADGVTIAPTWRWAGILIPRFALSWDDIRSIDIAAGPLGARQGIRFVLKHRVDRSQRSGFAAIWPWAIFVWRPMVWLPPGAIDRALALLPPGIPTRTRRGFIFWP